MWLFLFSSFLLSCVQADNSPPRPHIVVLIADDYGWANFGPHTSADSPAAAQRQREVHTPNLDAIVADGVLLEQHYAFKICAPSRSSFQSGRLPVHVLITNVSPLVTNSSDPVSGYAGIPRNMTGVATKLRAAGYRTAMVGKWDAGMATPDHTPHGRGYEEWMGYFQHANDYWEKGAALEAIGEIDTCLNHFHDFSEHNSSYRGGVVNKSQLDASCKNSTSTHPACYESHIFKERALSILDRHDPSEPLFYVHAFHLMHTPLEVPLHYLTEADRLAEPTKFDDSGRRNYSAMVHYMDDVVGELVDKLKAKHMWDDTLVVFFADNGGPIYRPGSANNHPLRGGKFSDFQGGVRTNAFVSGGFVPEKRRGGTYDGVISVADWYGTFCELAGADKTDTRAASANTWLKQRDLPLLHPVDSVSGLWDAIASGQNTNTRPVLHMSPQAVLVYPYKLIIGEQPYSLWQGELYPNCSTPEKLSGLPWPKGVKFFDHPISLADNVTEEKKHLYIHDCGDGCLFDISNDPNEHVDLATNKTFSLILKKLQEQLATLNEGNFNPLRGEMSDDMCNSSFANGGYYGPFVDSQSYYTGPIPAYSPEQQEKNAKTAALIKEVNRPLVKQILIAEAERTSHIWAPGFLEKFDFCLPLDVHAPSIDGQAGGTSMASDPGTFIRSMMSGL